MSPLPKVWSAGRRVYVRMPLDVWTAIHLPWRRSRVLPAVALWETLVFDFRSGRTCLRLEGEGETMYECCDLCGCTARGDPLMERLDRLPALREALAAAFAAQWGQPLPFGGEELTAERFALLCAFIGYGREFYDAVPLRRGGLAPPREFRRAARGLHRISALPELVASCGLPQIKSVRRRLFARPALLFYADVLPVLSAMLPDPNCLSALLGYSHVFSLLSALQHYPASAAYYVDLGRSVGSPLLLRLLREGDCNLLMSALRYAAMNKRARREEHRHWHLPYAALEERCCPYFAHEDELGYSLPVPQEADSPVPRCSSAGAYRFERLASVRDFTNAGAALGNCLSEMPWFFTEGSVFAVRSDGGTVAAIYLKGRTILQAFAAHNRPIDPDTSLGIAFAFWSAKYELAQAED